MVDLNHLALLADLALSAADRTRLNGYCSIFSAFGCLSVFTSYYVWDKDNIASFRMFCCGLSLFAVVGFSFGSVFLKNHLKYKKIKGDNTPVQENGKRLVLTPKIRSIILYVSGKLTQEWCTVLFGSTLYCYLEESNTESFSFPLYA